MVAQHPTHDELHSYLLDSLPARKSVRIAEHLLICPTCVEASAEIEDWISYSHRALIRPEPVNGLVLNMPAPVARMGGSAVNAHGQRHAGYGAIAACILALGTGTLTFHRVSLNHQPVPSAAIEQAASPVEAEPLEMESPSLAEDSPQPIMRRAVARGNDSGQPVKRFVRPFIPPVKSASRREPRLLTPPAEFSYSVASMGSFHFASLPHDLQYVPEFTGKSGKRNLLVRFFATVARPFRSDGTNQ